LNQRVIVLGEVARALGVVRRRAGVELKIKHRVETIKEILRGLPIIVAGGKERAVNHAPRSHAAGWGRIALRVSSGSSVW